MTSILNLLGLRQRNENEDIENQNDGGNHGTSQLLLPFETKASAIRENVDVISRILDQIPLNETSEAQLDVAESDLHADSLLQIANKLQSMLKDIHKLQKQNYRFAKTYWVRYPQMVRMQNSRFADVVQHVRRITDATSEVHSKYQAVQKELLHKQSTHAIPDATHDEVKAFVEGWRNGDKLLEKTKYNYAPVAENETQTLALVAAGEKKKLKARRNKIQAMSKKLTGLYDIMHDLSKVLSEHEEASAKIEKNIEESLFTMKDGERNGTGNTAGDEQNAGDEETTMRQIRKENKIAFGLTLGIVILWFMLRETAVL